MRVFFDTSAFAKRYIREAGTDEVLAWCERASELALAVIAMPELISAFRRLSRERRLTETQYRQLKSDLAADVADAFVCDVNPLVLKHAITALEATAIRGMDAIHVGAAQACSAEIFISADARQCAAAAKAGLRVVQV
jgi:predicted nucleic acid-binding protein